MDKTWKEGVHSKKIVVELILVLATLQCWCSLATLLHCWWEGQLATLHWRTSRQVGCREVIWQPCTRTRSRLERWMTWGDSYNHV